MYSTKQKIDAENYKQYVKLLLKQYNGKYLVIFDTETTGKTKNDYIVQFAAKRYLIDNERLVFDAKIQEYIQPPVIMSEKVTEINGLTNDFLSDKPLVFLFFCYLCHHSVIAYLHSIQFHHYEFHTHSL